MKQVLNTHTKVHTKQSKSAVKLQIWLSELSIEAQYQSPQSPNGRPPQVAPSPRRLVAWLLLTNETHIKYRNKTNNSMETKCWPLAQQNLNAELKYLREGWNFLDSYHQTQNQSIYWPKTTTKSPSINRKKRPTSHSSGEPISLCCEMQRIWKSHNELIKHGLRVFQNHVYAFIYSLTPTKYFTMSGKRTGLFRFTKI